ncbi:MAG: hypothetical protein ACJ73E_07735, partial [Mycobacteriales bacterium]
VPGPPAAEGSVRGTTSGLTAADERLTAPDEPAPVRGDGAAPVPARPSGAVPVRSREEGSGPAPARGRPGPGTDPVGGPRPDPPGRDRR